jgi:transposase-like protein
MARPPEKTGHVDPLDGSDADKTRLRVVLETVTGERSVKEACERLGVSEARFHVLRRQALQAALDRLASGAPGRPPKPDEPDGDRVRELEQGVSELKVDLQAALVRTEIALTMPHLLRETRGKKNTTPKRRRPKRHKAVGSSDTPGDWSEP